MKTVYLHIGAHKTGTSALQHFLWNNRQQLASVGYLYPDLGRDGYSHGMLANIIKPNNADPRLTDYRDRFQKQVLGSDDSRIILSSEAFLEGENIAAAVREFLPADQCNVRVIVFLRNQCDWLESVFHEIVRDPYRRYTGDIKHMREYEQGLHDYQMLLSPWILAFGGDALELCPYELAKSRGDIYRHFLSLLDIPEDSIAGFDISPGNPNFRLHALASEFLARLNRYPLLNHEHQTIVRDLQKLSPKLQEQFGGGFRRMTDSMIHRLRDGYLTSNRRLFEQYSRYGAQTLFDEAGRHQEVRDASARFDPGVQEIILDGLSLPSRESICGVVPEWKRGGSSERLTLPPPASDEVQRLNDVIMRQRLELRRLYQGANNGLA